MQRQFDPEPTVFRDPDTDASVMRWTTSPARDNVLYFTTPTKDARAFITDGGEHITRYRPDADGSVQARQICRHGSIQPLNQDGRVHRPVTPSGDSVVFASNAGEVSNVYEAEIPGEG
ncbi:MAG: hypothetical protein AAGJ38_02315 [Planctomycetota bacterium]